MSEKIEIEIGDLVTRTHNGHTDGPYIYYVECKQTPELPHLLFCTTTTRYPSVGHYEGDLDLVEEIKHTKQKHHGVYGMDRVVPAQITAMPHWEELREHIIKEMVSHLARCMHEDGSFKLKETINEQGAKYRMTIHIKHTEDIDE